MRNVRAIIGLLAVAGGVAAAFVVACGGSDSGGGVGSDDAAMPISDAQASSDTSDPPDDNLGDAPFMSHADAGCPVKYQGPNIGMIAESIPRAGSTSVAWSNPNNARTVDGLFASVSLDTDQASEHLRITGYGFKLPPTVTIHGVVVELKRQGANEIIDGNIELWLDGKPSSRPKFVASGWPVAIGTHHYGQEVDTWGDDLTPELVGRQGFGTEIYALRREDAGTGPATGSVESLLITIWYCE